MTRHRSHSQATSAVVIFGLILAGLIGLAYLVNNINSSQAATQFSPSTNPKDYLLPRSPYSECQNLLDKANRKITNDNTYRKLLDKLGVLLKERDAQIKILNDSKSTADQKRTAKIRLQILAYQIRDAQAAAGEYHRNVFAEYENCLNQARGKLRPSPWWQFQLPVLRSTPVLPSNRTTAI